MFVPPGRVLQHGLHKAWHSPGVSCHVVTCVCATRAGTPAQSTHVVRASACADSNLATKRSRRWIQAGTGWKSRHFTWPCKYDNSRFMFLQLTRTSYLVLKLACDKCHIFSGIFLKVLTLFFFYVVSYTFNS